MGHFHYNKVLFWYIHTKIWRNLYHDTYQVSLEVCHDTYRIVDQERYTALEDNIFTFQM